MELTEIISIMTEITSLLTEITSVLTDDISMAFAICIRSKYSLLRIYFSLQVLTDTVFHS